MGFFRNLFSGGAAPDPTVDWPSAADLATPSVDLAARLIGPVKFGDPIHEARKLGRPEKRNLGPAGFIDLVYARAGFLLQFQKDRMDYAAFFIGPDEFVPDVDGLRFCEPVDQAGHRFSATTTEPDLVTTFGRPTEVDRDSDETIVNFIVNGVLLEFELNPAGKLKRWNLYPKERLQ